MTRLFEEMLPPPTEENSYVLIVSYAGFTGESELLENLYKRGMTGKHIDEELECYESEGLFMFWSHTPRQPWQLGSEGEKYYAEQRRILRPNQFARQHRNEWVSSEDRFITPELWDPCVHPSHCPLVATHEPLFVGVDAATKHDTAAVVAVTWDADGKKLILASHRVWKPSPREPLDLEATIEEHLRELCDRSYVVEILCDPYQLHRSITTLQAAGLPIKEFPQTTANTTLMGQQLFDLLNGKNIVLYPAKDLREQALNTVAVESARGFRIAKEKASKKIDAIVALAMACVSAMQSSYREPFEMPWSGGETETSRGDYDGVFSIRRGEFWD